MSKRVVVVVAGLMLVAIAAVFYLFGGNPLRGGIQGLIEPRSAMTIDDVLAGFESLPGLPVTDSAYVTEDVCPEVGCIQALRSDEVSVYKFADRDDAAKFTKTLGADGYQSDWVVLEYDDARSNNVAQLSYANTVDGMWTTD